MKNTLSRNYVLLNISNPPCILFTILQTSTSVRQESITATPMLSVTTLKALTFVHANQDITETALTAQVK